MQTTLVGTSDAANTYDLSWLVSAKSLVSACQRLIETGPVMSMSAAVVSRPRESRTQALACNASSPIASSTCEGCVAPAVR